MKQESRAMQPSCIENTSSPQRPKRSTGPKSLDNSNGLLWTEEKELKRALYASLQESRKMLANEDSASKGVKNDGTRQGQVGVAAANSGEVSPKRTRVHAQRKFAQGSTPNSPLPTPVKVSSVNNVATDLFPSRRPKTEDFLTFLCLRGTPILPKAFDFLNNYTRGVSDSEGEPELESDPEDSSSQRGQNSIKPEIKGKPNGLSTTLENGTIPRKNVTKALTPKKKAEKDSSDGISLTLSESAPVKNHQVKLENGVVVSNKRKAPPEPEEPVRKKRLASLKPLGSTPSSTAGSALATSETPKHSSVEALKEKYKKQRLAKKVQHSKPQKEVAKPNSSVPPKKVETKASKPTKPPVQQQHQQRRWTAKAKQGKLQPPPASQTPASKPKPEKRASKAKHAVLATRRVLRSRKSLRLSSRKKALSVGVMPHLRKAKLVPPVVDFDSDESDLESECSVESRAHKPPAKSLRREAGKSPPPAAKSTKLSEKSKPKVTLKSGNSSSSAFKKPTQSHGTNFSPKSSSLSSSMPLSSSSCKKSKSSSKKKSSSPIRKPVEESSDESEEDLPMRMTRSAKAKETIARIASLSKNHKLPNKKKSSSKKKHIDKKASKKNSDKKTEKSSNSVVAESEGKSDGKKEKLSDESKTSQKKSDRSGSKKNAKKSSISKASKKTKSSSKKSKLPDKEKSSKKKEKEKSSGKSSPGKSDKKFDPSSHQKSKKRKGHNSSSNKLQKLLEDLEDVEESDTPLSLISSKGLHSGSNKGSEPTKKSLVETSQDKDKKSGSQDKDKEKKSGSQDKDKEKKSSSQDKDKDKKSGSQDKDKKKFKSSSKKSERHDSVKVSQDSSSNSIKKTNSKNPDSPSKPSKMFFKSSSSEKLASKSKDFLVKKLGKSSSTTDVSSAKDDLPLAVLAKKHLVYDQFDFSDSSDSFSDFQPLKKKRKPSDNTATSTPKEETLQKDKIKERKVGEDIKDSSDSDSDLFPLKSISSGQSSVPYAKMSPAMAQPKKSATNSSDANSTPKKQKPSNKETKDTAKPTKFKKEVCAKQRTEEATEKDTSNNAKQVASNATSSVTDASSATKPADVPQKEPPALSSSSEDTVRRPTSPPALSIPPDCPPDYVEAASYMVQEMSEEVPGLESVSDEAARTLPSDLVFGTPEDIHGLMTSEFSGVFDEAFTTGAILLTTRDTLAQIPLNFLHELTPTKTVVDAATNTCEDDILSCIQVETPPKSDETSVGTQTMTPAASPAPPLLESVVSALPKTPTTPPLPVSSTPPSSSSSSPKQKPKSPKTTIPLATFASKKRNKVPKKPKLEAKEPFPLPTDPPKLTEAPVYHPSMEEFQDPLEFMKKIQPEAEKYGICKIVPPSSFKPECKVNDDMRFTAHNQYVHKMLYRWGPNVQHLACIRKHLKAQGVTLDQSPLIGGIELDLSKLYHTVRHFGGLQQVIEKKKWQRVADAMHVPKAAQERVTKLYDAYCKYLVSYDLLPDEEKQKLEADVVAEHEQKLQQNTKDRDEDDSDDENGDCVLKGRSTSLSSFYRIARNTMAMWYKNDPSPDEVENDFWKIVKERKQHVVVHAGNIDSSVYGSGFPSGKSSSFAKHPWNLKVLTNNSGSILRCMGPVSGVTIPTLHVGMLFTTGCWYRDPHCLPWIEYLHTGASKIWYGIPASFYEQFRVAMNKIMPYCCTSNPIWLPSDTAMVPPSLLVEQGCSLSRVVQHSGQFIVVFPGAFTSNICCGYSVSESVYFAPPEWLDLAEQAFQAIQLSHEPPAFSLERLLFSIVSDAKTGVETLTRLLPMVSKIRDRELQLRTELDELGLKVAERLPQVEGRDKKRRSKGQDEENEQECEVCRTHCCISMVVNSQDDTIYCLDHARAHVQKKKNLKFCKLMYTYDEEELNEIIRKTVQQLEVLEQKGLAKKKSPKKKTTP